VAREWAETEAEAIVFTIQPAETARQTPAAVVVRVAVMQAIVIIVAAMVVPAS